MLYSFWFYFYITGIKKHTKILFSIINLNGYYRLFANGFRPVYKNENTSWQRITGKFTFNQQDRYPLNFTFEHLIEVEEDQKTFFALTYPFSYKDCQDQINYYEQILSKTNEIYFKRELLIYSSEKRRIELITISSKDQITSNHEELIPNCFPETKSSIDRPFIFENKQTIFITARVHSGEVQGSHMMNGILKFLLNQNNETSRAARKNFVWKIVPMLNPDGVYNGYFRLDTLAQNLNRFYQNPSLINQPSIYATKMAVLQQHYNNKLSFYIDLHGHVAKHGIFVFGNPLEEKAQVENILFAKLMSLNNPLFDYNACIFSEENSKKVDHFDGTTREGSGRVSIYKETLIPNCYTIECGFHNSKKVANIPPLYRKSSGRRDPESDIIKIMTETKSGKSPPFCNEIMEEFGKVFIIRQ